MILNVQIYIDEESGKAVGIQSEMTVVVIPSIKIMFWIHIKREGIKHKLDIQIELKITSKRRKKYDKYE